MGCVCRHDFEAFLQRLGPHLQESERALLPAFPGLFPALGPGPVDGPCPLLLSPLTNRRLALSDSGRAAPDGRVPLRVEVVPEPIRAGSAHILQSFSTLHSVLQCAVQYRPGHYVQLAIRRVPHALFRIHFDLNSGTDAICVAFLRFTLKF